MKPTISTNLTQKILSEKRQNYHFSGLHLQAAFLFGGGFLLWRQRA